MNPVDFLQPVPAIRESVFISRRSVKRADQMIVHRGFLQDMETKLSFKRAIEYADVEILRRTYEWMSLIFHGGQKAKYTQLSS